MSDQCECECASADAHYLSQAIVMLRNLSGLLMAGVAPAEVAAHMDDIANRLWFEALALEEGENG